MIDMANLFTPPPTKTIVAYVLIVLIFVILGHIVKYYSL